MPKEDRNEDKEALIQILNTIEKQLHDIVSKASSGGTSSPRFRKEFVDIFSDFPWQQVKSNLDRARDMIAKDEVDWEYIEGTGMAGPVLQWKKRVFDETVRQGVVSRFFKVANSILGSLSKAVPPLEFVKECKEMVEAALRYGRG